MERELLSKYLQTIIDMPQSGMVHMLKDDKIDGTHLVAAALLLQ